jgi:N-acetyltransferase
MNFDLRPALENDLLVLRPLRATDFENLYQVASDPLIWEQHPEKSRFKREVFEVFFKEAIDSGGAFAVIDKKTGEIIGSTRFSRVKETQNAIEIGWTFLARRFWGGPYNKSMKLLLMDYAFNFVANIVFCIDENNIRSRRAVEKLGGERITELEDKILETRKKTTVIYKINKQILIR